MPTRTTILAVILSSIVASSAAQASDVWIKQARGRMPGGTATSEDNKPAKTVPEGGATTAATGSPTTPATCNQQNASSPACYSATQQAKGK